MGQGTRGPGETRRILETLSSQRGSMLVVVLFVLVALTSVASVAVQRVNEELQYAGNVRKGSSAFNVTVSGSFVALGRASDLGAAGFVTDFQDNAASDMDGDPDTRMWPRDWMVTGTPYFDLSGTGSFGYEGLLSTADAEAGDSPFDVNVTISDTGMKQPLLGYSVTGPGARCRFKYQFDAEGRIGNKFTITDPDTEVHEQQDVYQRVRSYMYVGPLPCDATGAGTGTI